MDKSDRFNRWSERFIYAIQSVTPAEFSAVQDRLGVTGRFGDPRFSDAYDTIHIVADTIEEAIKTFERYSEPFAGDIDHYPLILSITELGVCIEWIGS